MSGLLASLLMAVGLMKVYVEDVFSAYTYTGNGGTQSIVNGIDLAGSGGLVWIKGRNGFDHYLADTIQGVGFALKSNSTAARTTIPGGYNLTAFNSNGFSLGLDFVSGVNESGESRASWTFRKAPKFFDFGTFTAGSSTNRRITHALGVAPGVVFVKCLNNAENWQVYHRSLSGTAIDKRLLLNSTAAEGSVSGAWGTSAPTSADFGIGEAAILNSGNDYVWYAFAHDTGTDGLIQCGTFTTDGSGNATVTLPWEPQFVQVKQSSGTGDWLMFDASRGMSRTDGKRLSANTSSAESTTSNGAIGPNATGFNVVGSELPGSNNSATFIYKAIRAPMKVPTDATKVFKAIARTGNSGTYNVTGVGFAPDVVITGNRSNAAYRKTVISRLRGAGKWLNTSGTDSEGSTASEALQEFSMDGHRYVNDGSGQVNYSGYTYLDWCFKRAPGFMQEVCYTGTGSAKTEAHGLGVAPELWISKSRSATNRWVIGCSYLPTPASDFLELSTSTKGNDTTTWNNTVPTASVFSVGTGTDANSSGVTYDMLLFATCPGVSKVGGYIGTGTTLQINCGFAAGARFVLIKRTTVATGDWYLWDSVRGIVSGNDPYLLLNSAAAEVTGTDYIDQLNSGFEISSTAPAAINASGGTFIFLAIA